jgi:hypothetical protein
VAGVIYSRQLCNLSITAGAGSQLVYTVPAATVVVVTNVDYWVENSAANQLSFVELESAIIAAHTSVAAENISVQWAGRQVLTAGQTINLFWGGVNPRIAATGYLLGP